MTETQTALADAYASALARAHSPDTSPPDPDAEAREAVTTLQHIAPSVGVAAALLNAAATCPVPVSRDTLEATSDPLTTLQAVEHHWRLHPSDGVGVQAGSQLSESVVVAVTGAPPDLRRWLSDVATEPVERLDEFGKVTDTSRAWRPGPAPMQLAWQPPGVVARSWSADGAQLRGMEDRVRSEARAAIDATEAWLVWIVSPVDGHRLVVKPRRIATGVSTVGDGELVPWHVRRANRWTLAGAGLPSPTDAAAPPWLLDELGAKWKVA